MAWTLGIDKGIDLIAETYDGGVVAMQAKHYDEQHWISKRDMDTFLQRVRPRRHRRAASVWHDRSGLE